ncbi:MAG: alpha-1,2-fucosyltransferase, partial [Bacilli bacterium]|nr:alpha-1,2-fucosyltransferase [Bacilli bacterium]
SDSLHVRRGDYVLNSTTNKVHGTCGINYYNKAIDIVTKENPEAVFFVFSDDCDWARNNLKINHEKYFIDFNGKENCHEDIRLMSLCKHNIIANSSFSWWGAWLNNNKNKIVVAPKKWFNVKINTKDLVPENWIKI